MRKSNIAFMIVAAVVAILLLILWFMLGFNKVDAPLDIVLTVVWFAVIVIAIASISKAEQARKRSMRTVYGLKGGRLFSPELGMMPMIGEIPLDQAIADLLGSLSYPMQRKDVVDELADGSLEDVEFIVESDKFSRNENPSDPPSWKGRIITFDPSGRVIETEFADADGMRAFAAGVAI